MSNPSERVSLTNIRYDILHYNLDDICSAAAFGRNLVRIFVEEIQQINTIFNFQSFMEIHKLNKI